MATLGSLKTSISAKLTDGVLEDPTSSQLTEIINSNISRYCNRNFWFLFDSATITLNADDSLVPDIPADFKSEVYRDGLVIYYNQIRYPLPKFPPDLYDLQFVNGKGLPYAYTFRNGEYHLIWKPDQAYTLILNYKKSMSTLSADGDSNPMTVYADRLVQYACLREIYATFKRDVELTAFYKQLEKEEFDEIMKESRERGGSGLLTPDGSLPYYYAV